MKLGVLTVALYDRSFEDALKYLHGLGVQTVEVGVGGFPGDNHSNASELVKDDAKIKAFKELVKKYDMEISALSTHNNPVHPDADTAALAQAEIERAIILAEKLGVNTIVGFSGCPGDAPGAKNPNWVTCQWPNVFRDILNYQWNDVLVPYWEKTAKFAKDSGVNIALEIHPGFCVYNTDTMLKLRREAGDNIGANFDPSHLFWQGIDPVQAIKALKGAIYHFHAKDVKIDNANTAVTGVLDTLNDFTNVNQRSWVFRTVGYGHGKEVWNDMISTLKATGYDGAISIEHEDAYMSPVEGLEKAISFLKDVIIYQSPGEAWWA